MYAELFETLHLKLSATSEMFLQLLALARWWSNSSIFITQKAVQLVQPKSAITDILRIETLINGALTDIQDI